MNKSCMWEACVFIGILGLLLAFLQWKSLKEGFREGVPIRNATKEGYSVQGGSPDGRGGSADGTVLTCYGGGKTEITTREECVAAGKSLVASGVLKSRVGALRDGSWSGHPKGCFAGNVNVLYWNHHPTGCKSGKRQAAGGCTPGGYVNGHAQPYTAVCGSGGAEKTSEASKSKPPPKKCLKFGIAGYTSIAGLRGDWVAMSPADLKANANELRAFYNANKGLPILVGDFTHNNCCVALKDGAVLFVDGKQVWASKPSSSVGHQRYCANGYVWKEGEILKFTAPTGQTNMGRQLPDLNGEVSASNGKTCFSGGAGPGGYRNNPTLFMRKGGLLGSLEGLGVCADATTTTKADTIKRQAPYSASAPLKAAPPAPPPEPKANPPPAPPPVIPQGPCPKTLGRTGGYSCGGKKTLCQNNSQIGGVAECKEATEALGLDISKGSDVGMRQDIPAGCSWENGKMYWSTNSKNPGSAHANLSPVCLNQVAGGFVMKKESDENVECPVVSKEIHLKLHQAEIANKKLEKLRLKCRRSDVKTFGQAWKSGVDKDDELLFMRGKTVEGSYVPSGTIIMWAGEKPPPGWLLCNGSKNTPDLRNRFVLGVGNEKIGKKGGSSKILISQLPRHEHESLGDESRFSLGTADSMNESAGKWETVHIKSWSQGHKIYTKTQDAGLGKDYYPPYYRLAFIMKI